VDEKPETFPVAFPMSQIALYAGWYDANVSGPFTRPKVEFMPGAFAYHLHSFSARFLRSATQTWCGPLLAAGVTATMGCIDEPYLDASPDVGLFFARWLPGGFTFGEAAYACQRAISWQTTVVGDPLYRPIQRTPRAQHALLEQRHSKLVEWSDLQLVDKGLQLGATPREMAQALASPEMPQDSAVLAEKLAELDDMLGLSESAIKALQNALTFKPTPQQRVRLTLTLADKLIAVGRGEEALALYDTFLKNNPDYPDVIGFYTKMQTLATKLHQTRQAEKCAQAIARLTAGK
jgi:tetratricopeptide (TPR) repeat protein